MTSNRMRRADLIAAIVLIALGVAVAYGSWTMPRLENRGIHPASVPGLVPGLLGLALAACGGILAFQSRGGGAETPGAEAPDRAGLARLAVATGLTLAYALVLVGTVPFWLATTIFVFVFILVFEWMSDAPRPGVARIAGALVQAVAVAVAAVVVFERLFLVRLP